MRFRTLGPLRVRAGDRWSAIGAAHQRLLLAILLIEAGRAVPTDRLVREIWGDRPPRTAVHAVHVYVRRLRELLGGEILVTRGQAYELMRADTDANAFEELVAAARHSSDPRTVVSQLSQGLSLWRGPAFEDVPESPHVVAEAARLDQIRLTAIEDKLEAMLELGHAAEVIDALAGFLRALGAPGQGRLPGRSAPRQPSWLRGGFPCAAHRRTRRIPAGTGDRAGADTVRCGRGRRAVSQPSGG